MLYFIFLHSFLLHPLTCPCSLSYILCRSVFFFWMSGKASSFARSLARSSISNINLTSADPSGQVLTCLYVLYLLFLTWHRPSVFVYNSSEPSPPPPNHFPVSSKTGIFLFSLSTIAHRHKLPRLRWEQKEQKNNSHCNCSPRLPKLCSSYWYGGRVVCPFLVSENSHRLLINTADKQTEEHEYRTFSTQTPQFTHSWSLT